MIRTPPLSLLLAASVLANVPAAAPAAATATDDTPFLPLYAEMLERDTRAVQSTVGTTVDYRALLQEPGRARWQAILAGLERLPEPSDRAGRLAYWINAYNVLAIDMVARHYPVESIRDIGSFFRQVWDREAGRAAGRTVTLGEVEHEILRPMGDPRIHAAIVCASTSCPSLAREPFTADAIDAQLDRAMREFLKSRTKGLRIDRAAERITVSRIFSWFDDDFEELGGVGATVRRYAPEPDRAWLREAGTGARLRYFKYDWSLNDVNAEPPNKQSGEQP